MISQSLRTWVSVNRSKHLHYPAWVQKVLAPELQERGPSRYDLSKLLPWLTPDQQAGKEVKARLAYNLLEQEGLLPRCLGLQDALAIREMGPEIFRSVFGGKGLLLPRGAVLDRKGRDRAPFLDACSDHVRVHWISLDGALTKNNPIPLFPI